MLSGFKNLFRPPVFDDLEKAAQARSLHTILLGVIALTCLFIIYVFFFPPPGQLNIAILALAFEIAMLFLVQARRIQLASAMVTSFLWVAIVLEVALYGGIRDTGFGNFAAIILIAGLTMGARSGFLFAALSLGASVGLAFAEHQGYLPAYSNVPITSVLLSHSIELIAVVLLFTLAVRSISSITQKVIAKEKVEQEANLLLQASQADLQQRTSALEKQNLTLQTVTAVSRITNEVNSENELLEQSAKLLLEQNKLGYVGIFVLDQMEENAILQTSCGQAGKPLPRAEYKLNVIRSESTNPLMGINTLHFKIGARNYYIELPKQLPNMQTTLVFPLVSKGYLYGLLNIQDESPDSQDIEKQTWQTVADQITLSMANIRLLDQLQSRIREIGLLVGGSVQSAWEQLESGEMIGFNYNRLQVMAGNESFPPDVTDQLLAGKSVSFVSADATPRARLAAPIILRENIIGVVGYDNENVNHEWQDDEKVLLEAVASRVSLALENTRLVAEAQQRAERERVIGQVTTRMRETLDIETILKTAVMEMRQSLGLREAEIRLQLTEENLPAEGNHE